VLVLVSARGLIRRLGHPDEFALPTTNTWLLTSHRLNFVESTGRMDEQALQRGYLVMLNEAMACGCPIVTANTCTPSWSEPSRSLTRAFRSSHAWVSGGIVEFAAAETGLVVVAAPVPAAAGHRATAWIAGWSPHRSESVVQ
jgi:hypothetical protein